MSAPIRPNDRVTIVNEEAGAHFGKTGTVLAVSWRAYGRGRRKTGWYATVLVDRDDSLPASVDRSRTLHVDGLRAAARHRDAVPPEDASDLAIVPAAGAAGATS